MSAPPSSTRATPRRRGRVAIALWLLGLALCALVTARARYVADLSAFLPSASSAEQAVLLDQLRSGTAARLVLAGIEGGTAESRAAASLAWGQTLRESGLFESVDNGDARSYAALGSFLFEHRYLLSPAVDAQRFTVDGLRGAIDETVSLLGTPAGAMVKPVLLRDPTGETVRMAEAMLPAHAPRSEGGAWASRSAPRAVLVATTRADGADLDGQQRALEFMRASFAPHAAQGLRLAVSGAGSFAVASRAQIKREVERLAIAGSVAVVLMMAAAFGSLRALAIAVLPVGTGVLAGIATVALGFGQVHGITLGFGTTLIGEAVDYAIYYLIQAHSAPAADGARGAGARRWIAASWPTVRLGLWTSLCGFAALVFSGFPGLAQLGAFSVAGLVAAALATRFVLPVLAPDGAPGQGLRRRLGAWTGRAAAWLPRLRGALLAVSLIALAALLWLPSPWRGSLASLSPVSGEALKLDAQLRADVGATEAGTLVALSAPDEAAALNLAEAAGARLDRLVADGAIEGYDTPARLLPSPATQTARRAALPDADTLRARLAQAAVDGPIKAERLAPFVADVQAARTQPLLTRASLQGTPLATALDAMLLPGRDGGPWRVLLSLHAGERGADALRLRAALADLPGARVVQIGAELDALYARYLHEATWQAGLGALAVLALLGVYLRSWRRLLGIAQPLAAALLIVLAALSLRGAALGILHLVGLLLVVAIGSNYALFFDQLRHGGAGADGKRARESDTLASLLLANLTIVVSFALLALSSIPALYAIGEVVAPGTLLCLLLSAAFVRGPRGGAGVHGEKTGGEDGVEPAGDGASRKRDGDGAYGRIAAPRA
jgi:predicted exporter